VFVNNLTNFVAAYGYDGVDIDWESLYASDIPQYTNFVNTLRSALNTFSQPKLLTAAVSTYPPTGDPPTAEYKMFAAIQNQFDQLKRHDLWHVRRLAGLGDLVQFTHV